MNADTQRDVTNTLNDGFYRKSMTLGEGGWSYLYGKGGIGNWKTYQLIDVFEGEVETIIAKDDQSAIKAFDSLFHLDSFPYEIREVITTTRRVASEIKEEY